jgi:hypothetical protein
MLRIVFERLRRFRQRLTRLDSQPLNKVTLIVVIFLDVFILTSIFDGLEDHTSQLTSPSDQIPQLCSDVVIDGNWNSSNRLDNLTRMITLYNTQHYTPPKERDSSKQHPLCTSIVSTYHAIRDDTALAGNFRQLQDIRRETQNLRTDLDRMKGAYDTQLLEGIAAINRPGVDASAIGKTLGDKTAHLNELVGKQGMLEDSLQKDAKVNSFLVLVANIGNADRIVLRDELRQLNYWYPVKRLAMEMLFLLPLLAAFYFWNAHSISRNKPFQALVSSHLLVVVCIPVILKIMRLVYDIIPRRILRQFIELLESFKLVAIWHYLLIAVAILAAMALIYLFQKKLFSQEKLMLRRIAKGQCQECGLQLPSGSRYCTGCGAPQYLICTHCKQPTHLHGNYCNACGLTVPDVPVAS